MTWRCPGCDQEIAIIPRDAERSEGLVVEHWRQDREAEWIWPWSERKRTRDRKVISARFVCRWSGALVRIENGTVKL